MKIPILTLGLIISFLSSAAYSNDDLYAPMPGMVNKVFVVTGQYVTKGTPIIETEAMKMQLTLCAGQDGYITKILVEKGQVLDGRVLLAQFSQNPPVNDVLPIGEEALLLAAGDPVPAIGFQKNKIEEILLAALTAKMPVLTASLELEPTLPAEVTKLGDKSDEETPTMLVNISSEGQSGGAGTPHESNTDIRDKPALYLLEVSGSGDIVSRSAPEAGTYEPIDHVQLMCTIAKARMQLNHVYEQAVKVVPVITYQALKGILMWIILSSGIQFIMARYSLTLRRIRVSHLGSLSVRNLNAG